MITIQHNNKKRQYKNLGDLKKFIYSLSRDERDLILIDLEGAIADKDLDFLNTDDGIFKREYEKIGRATTVNRPGRYLQIDNFREAVEMKGWTFEMVAKKVKIRPETISRWLRGRKVDERITNKLGAILGLPKELLFI